jgi:hypothetical protein
VHRYDPHTYVLRQSKALTAEAPFLYLVFGSERAVLFDTGASKKTVGNPLRETVDGIVEAWLAEHPREGYHLVVAHTHGHLDHVEGDAQFADRPATTIVDRELEAMQEFFGFTSWPDEIVRFMERTVEFAREREITHVMGCHIEMTRRPGRDYPVGCRYQPDERPLEMTVQELIDLRDAARSIKDQPGAHTFDDFVILNGPARRYIFKILARALWAKIRPPRTSGADRRDKES